MFSYNIITTKLTVIIYLRNFIIFIIKFKNNNIAKKASNKFKKSLLATN